MRFNLLFSLLMFLTTFLYAHEVPVYPVDIKLRVDRSSISANIKVHHEMWADEIMGSGWSKIPGDGALWQPEWIERSEKFINQELQLAVDEKKLSGRIIKARYHEEPFTHSSNYRFIFDVHYDFDGVGNELIGKAQFFKEHYQERAEENFVDIGLHEEFITTLSISGPKKIKLIIPIEKPDFRIPLKDVLMTHSGYVKENLRFGFFDSFAKFPFSLFFVITLLFWLPLKSWFQGLSLFAGITTAGYLLRPALAFELSTQLTWLPVILICLPVIFKTNKTSWFVCLGLCGLFWGLSWPTPTPNLWGIRFAYVIGALFSGLLSAAATTIVLILYRRFLYKNSELKAESSFSSNVRFASVVLALISIFKLIQPFVVN